MSNQPSVVEIISLLERPFKLEQKYNFNNHSCSPSFSHYLNHWLEKVLELPQPACSSKRLKSLKTIFKDYASQNIDKREKIFQKGKKLLNESKSLIFLERVIQYVKGVGPKRASYLKNLEIVKVRDLLTHFPLRYEDRSKFTPISKVNFGDYVTVKGEIRVRDDVFTARRKRITKAIVDDGTDRIVCVWFNQPYMKKLLPIDKEIILSGKVTGFGEKQIVHPVFELVEKNDPVHTGRIVPIYPLTGKIGMRYLRTLVDTILKESDGFLYEYLPDNLINSKELMSFEKATKNIHFPESIEDKETARTRFIYEEFLFLQLGLVFMRNMKKENKKTTFKSEGELLEKLEEILPFSLTNSQKKVLNKIKDDMTSTTRMMRLLHGEVGAGKTVIALGAIILAKDNGYQSAIMAPTAVLAEQHYITLQKFALSLGMEIEFIVSGQKQKERREILKKLKDGKIDVLIGTHALLQENVEFKNLGLAVIDEEHKFGVLQRTHFMDIFSHKPEILVMSATPIPRSLALALYGDMDISTLNELPAGRAQTSTFWIDEKDKDKVYDFIKEELDKGRQVFIVTPLIEESEKLEVDSATEIFEFLKENVFSSYKLALLHGRIKKEEQQKIMKAFRNKKTDILVATSLIEVGIDIPSATVMVVLNAERFGLAQLHQLRGRIGRGEHKSYCILVSNPKTEEGKKRLKAMTSTSDGFKIAEEDLEIRGPGELLGTKQHGFPEIKLGNIIKDLELLEQAKQDAEALLKESPALENYDMLKDILFNKFPYIEKLLIKRKY
ncbi:MAG: ATP-dependent DNA helicase RecG [Candidatus Omnitrophica bacterium]|nr:ATP-dependent DNA helicase RecG [Candidatus Omnitrophota bacterium]MBU1047594.1 ATP-dependent DNA helicase RecG [Candidatus Omnitrophota bacterium]MBU1766983.1 ATP-dependent DNA helicase RecG [Candidatus Omnitrophota bacterium]MBU1888956.1 ATP-dependent DNA helicase RecG [Candidatus Omnitrophota bacterium]